MVEYIINLYVHLKYILPNCFQTKNELLQSSHIKIKTDVENLLNSSLHINKFCSDTNTKSLLLVSFLSVQIRSF